MIGGGWSRDLSNAHLLLVQVVSFNQVISLTENFIPIFFSFYIGSWSDKFGRKVIITIITLILMTCHMP